MNNREVIEQVERGYRMAQPSTITYPESKTLPSEVKIAQANVYKVRIFLKIFCSSTMCNLHIPKFAKPKMLRNLQFNSRIDS